MRYILFYVFHLFLFAAESPFGIGFSFLIMGYAAALLLPVLAVGALIDYSNEKRAAERFKMGRAFEVEEEEPKTLPTKQPGEMIWDAHDRKWVRKIGEDEHGMAEVAPEEKRQIIFIKE